MGCEWHCAVCCFTYLKDNVVLSPQGSITLEAVSKHCTTFDGEKRCSIQRSVPQQLPTVLPTDACPGRLAQRLLPLLSAKAPFHFILRHAGRATRLESLFVTPDSVSDSAQGVSCDGKGRGPHEAADRANGGRVGSGAHCHRLRRHPPQNEQAQACACQPLTHCTAERASSSCATCATCTSSASKLPSSPCSAGRTTAAAVSLPPKRMGSPPAAAAAAAAIGWGHWCCATRAERVGGSLVKNGAFGRQAVAGWCAGQCQAAHLDSTGAAAASASTTTGSQCCQPAAPAGGKHCAQRGCCSSSRPATFGSTGSSSSSGCGLQAAARSPCQHVDTAGCACWQS